MNPNQNKFTVTKFGNDAIDSVLVGVKEETRAVSTTLGPRGRNFLIGKGYETDIIHDGVKVSLAINPRDPFANAGAKIVKEATQRMRDEVGDGTTVCCVLLDAILDEALKATAAGINPMMLRSGLESGSRKVIDKISTLSTPVTTLEQKTQIATVSCQDEDLGKLIAETIHKIGDEGILTVDESKATETFVEHQEGMQVDKGFAHMFMMTDTERQLAILEDCYILVTDYPLITVSEIGKFLETVIFPNTKKVLFISPEVGNDFMTVLLGAKLQGAFNGVAMRAPGIGSVQTEMLQDMCALTGATLITKEAGMKFDEQPFTVLGHANRVIMSKISTIIEGGSGHKDSVLTRIASIKTLMEDESLSDWEIEQLKGRLGKLTNGVAVIKVGGQTEVEMKERKERAEDAKCATQAAIKHGFVPGGEVAYLAALDVLDETILGEKILKDALKKPFVKLVENAGFDGGQLLERLQYPKTKITKEEGFGIDVRTGEMENLLALGIIDPTAVPTTAVKTAVSVGIQISSLGGATVFEDEKAVS